MSKSWFPDLIGPSKISARSGTAINIRNRVLNVVSEGMTAVDNPSTRRTDLTLPDPAWVVVSATTADSGEWLPVDTEFAGADLVRVYSSTTGTILIGLNSNVPEEDPTDPTHLVKYVANVGPNSITIAETTGGHGLGKQYYEGSDYTLGASHAVRMTWDAVDRVYRIIGTVLADFVVLDGDRITLDGDRILNPE